MNLSISASGQLATLGRNLTLPHAYGAPGAVITSPLAYGLTAAIAVAGLQRHGGIRIRNVLLPGRTYPVDAAHLLTRFRA
jgi:hypothetical protein